VADTVRIRGVNEIRVRVSPNLAKKVMSVGDELSQSGVTVHTAQSQVQYRRLSDVVDAVKTTWLVYSILKEARNNWPAIRKILVSAGLSNHEIITLNLSQYTRKKSVKTKKR
jgi:hypothetical protein